MQFPIVAPRDDPPSSGEVPNYAGRMLWAIWSFTVGAGVFLALRVYCKLTRHRLLWWDDYVLIASWVGTVFLSRVVNAALPPEVQSCPVTNHPGGRPQVTVLTSTALLTEGVKYDIGMHYHDMDPEKMPVGTLISYAAGFATILGAAWSKTSFAMTLLRISSDPSSRWFLWFIIISVNVILGVSGLILWIQCWPIEKLWIYDMEAACWPKHIVEHYQTFTSIYSGILDIVLALLPWKLIWKVTINKKEKIGSLIAMSMGVLYEMPHKPTL